MRLTICGSILLCGVLCVSLPCQSQELAVTLIQSNGTGTAVGVPTHVDFWFHRSVDAETLEAATSKAHALADELTTALGEAKIPLSTLETSAPAVTNLVDNVAVASAKLQIALSRFTNSSKAASEFGILCDKVRSAADVIKCEIRGPILVTTDKDSLMKDAVKLAVENAYPPADAVADVLESEFFSVDSVRIDAIRWNQTPDTGHTEPNLGQISCTAEVSVTYAVTPK